jgi:RNA recognition motif-containing protein
LVIAATRCSSIFESHRTPALPWIWFRYSGKDYTKVEYEILGDFGLGKNEIGVLIAIIKPIPMKNIFVSNLSSGTSEQDLQALFESYGVVQSAKLVTDRNTGRSRGFAFIEMQNDGEAAKAITALNGKSVDERMIKVNEARPREERGIGNHRSAEKSSVGSNSKFGPLRVRQPEW